MKYHKAPLRQAFTFLFFEFEWYRRELMQRLDPVKFIYENSTSCEVLS